MSRETIGWTLYAIALIWIIVAGWRRNARLSARKALLDEMRRREHDRPKPPRRFIPRPGQ